MVECQYAEISKLQNRIQMDQRLQSNNEHIKIPSKIGDEIM